MIYELHIERYQGPMDKLLELIEEKKMDITEVSLAEVTADFLSYVQKLREKEKEETEDKNLSALIADFLVVASKLVLIKSKKLIPSIELDEEEEVEIKDLEERLKIYREFKRAREHVKSGWSELPKMLSREFLIGKEPVFSPPAAVGPEMLKTVIQKIIAEAEKLALPTQSVKQTIINLKTKIEEVMRKITDEPKKLGAFAESKNRSELIVLFLAILHLIKNDRLAVEQAEPFGEIKIARKNS